MIHLLKQLHIITNNPFSINKGGYLKIIYEL
jgi:hypothetical protein